MLLIQSAALQWGKAERGGKAAEARGRFPTAYPLPDFEKGALPGEAAEHSLYFRQAGTRIMDAAEEYRCYLERLTQNAALRISPGQIEQRVRERQRFIKARAFRSYPRIEDIHNPGLRFFREDAACRVRFFYDEAQMGAPYRRGRNEDYLEENSRFYGKDILNETAFMLLPGQYGRILYNERKIGSDTGEWYYLVHIINIALCPDGGFSPSQFLRKPDFCYQQLADLR